MSRSARKRKLFSIALKVELVEELEKLAEKSGRSRNNLIEFLLAKAIEGEKKNKEG